MRKEDEQWGRLVQWNNFQTLHSQLSKETLAGVLIWLKTASTHNNKYHRGWHEFLMDWLQVMSPLTLYNYQYCCRLRLWVCFVIFTQMLHLFFLFVKEKKLFWQLAVNHSYWHTNIKNYCIEIIYGYADSFVSLMNHEWAYTTSKVDKKILYALKIKKSDDHSVTAEKNCFVA